MKKYLFALMVFGAVFSCAPAKKTSMMVASKFDFQAHRGGRGLMPENTIPAMRSAINMPRVQTLEMDVVITKDGQVVVSHDPYFNHNITTTPEGKFLTAAEAQKLILYQLTYKEIYQYDVGQKPHPDFPRQKKIGVSKPLLTDLIDGSETEARIRRRSIQYNIEIKSKKATDNTHHPEPEVFVDKLVAVLKEKKILDRTVVQSFDIRPLQVLHQKYPNIKTSFLVDKDGGDIDRLLSTLGFEPTVYSPVYTVVTPALIEACHKRKIRIIPWTVNTKEEMQRLINMDIDGIISDYPDLFDLMRLK